jgi:hypothetical protein
MNATTPTTTTVTTVATALSAAQYKAIKKTDCDALLAVVLPVISFQDDDILKASSIRMNAAAAAAAMGGKATPQSLITGMVWSLAKAGHSRLEVPQGVPAGVVAMLQAAHAACGRAGHGFTVGAIKGAIKGAVSQVLAIGPAKKAEEAATPAPSALVAEGRAAEKADERANDAAAHDAAQHGTHMDNVAADSIAAHDAAYAACMQTAREKAAATIKADELNAAHAALREAFALIEQIKACKTIKEVKALLAA